MNAITARFHHGLAVKAEGRTIPFFRRWTAIHSGLFIVLALAAAAVALRAGSTDTPAYTIYDDNLQGAWQNWSWSTTVNLAETTYVYSGTHAISFAYTSAWGGLYLADNGSSVNTAPYTDLIFWVNGGTNSGQQVGIASYVNYGSVKEVPLDSYAQGGQIAANTWREVDVPLGDLDVSNANLTGIVLQDTTGGAQPAVYVDQIQLVNIPSHVTPTPTPGVITATVNVDANANVHAISPLIYGMAFASPDIIAKNNVTSNRWGGNATTRYNWKNNATNSASDWYFENHGGGSADSFIQGNITTGVASLLTVPTIGWVARGNNGWGFSVKKYGPQQATDPWNSDAGNGVTPGGQNITGNNPRDTSIPVSPTYMSAWVKHLVATFGPAGKGGVQFYAMDNEPELWQYTYRDIHPQGLTAAAELKEFLTYGTAVKQADPSAQVTGPVPWGWSAYFQPGAQSPLAMTPSTLTAGPDQRFFPPATTPDQLRQMAQADAEMQGQISHQTTLPFLAWFLQQVKAHDAKTHKRTLDVLDIHFYPQGSNVFGGGTDAATNALRLRETRGLWDPTYVDESWINQTMYVIPRMQGWINQYYPNTRLGISEWNFGADNTMNGALAIGTVLGIYGKYGVYSANYWTTPAQAGQLAFSMYRNYDGHNATFGNTSISAYDDVTSTLSVFAAKDGATGAVTLMLVNMDPLNNVQANVNLANFTAQGTAQVYQYSAANSQAITRLADITAGSQFGLSVPPYSLTLLVIPGHGAPVFRIRGHHPAAAPSGVHVSLRQADRTSLSWNAPDHR